MRTIVINYSVVLGGEREEVSVQAEMYQSVWDVVRNVMDNLGLTLANVNGWSVL